MLNGKRLTSMSLVIAIFALPTFIAWGGRYLERSPSFCASCHEMRPSYDGWTASGAAKYHADCITCHGGEGLSGILEAEARGVRMLGVHFFGGGKSGAAIRAKMPEAICLRCHSSEKVMASHTMFRTQGQTCADCHKHRMGWKFRGEVQP